VVRDRRLIEGKLNMHGRAGYAIGSLRLFGIAQQSDVHLISIALDIH
jgi:hypothetical protein